MTNEIHCPFCSSVDRCPHRLISLGKPGEVLGGSLAARMNRMWELIVEGVGEDPGGVLHESWGNLRDQIAAEADRIVEEGGYAGIFVADPIRMEQVMEACLPLEEL